MTEAVIEYWVCYGGQVVEVYTTYKVVRCAGPSFSRSPHFKKKTELFLQFTLFQPLGKNPLKMVTFQN